MSITSPVSNVPKKRQATDSEILERACRCAEVADVLKARDIVVLDLRKVTSICDYFVIATGTSTRQMKAIADEVHKIRKAEKHPTYGIEGSHDDHWILADYGDFVLHVFHPESRSLYDLEGLWADAPRIDWRGKLGLPPVASDK